MLAEKNSATPSQDWAKRITKSDHPIVPLKRVTTVEGRGLQNREDFVKDLNQPPVGDEKVVSDDGVYYSDPKLYSIAQKAKSLPLEKFSNLFHRVDEERVKKAEASWFKILSKQPYDLALFGRTLYF